MTSRNWYNYLMLVFSLTDNILLVFEVQLAPIRHPSPQSLLPSIRRAICYGFSPSTCSLCDIRDGSLTALAALQKEKMISGFFLNSSLLFTFIYTVDVTIRALAWGLGGGTMAFIHQNSFNKIDLGVTIM